MEVMEPRLRASPDQFLTMMEFMESHGDLSRPQQGVQGRLRSERLWRELTTLLNSVRGGVRKSADKWKKVWADWKTKTKKKYLVMRRASGIGGGPTNKSSLTSLEERVIAILGKITVNHCLTDIKENGFDILPHQTDRTKEENTLPPSQSPPQTSPPMNLPPSSPPTPLEPLSNPHTQPSLSPQSTTATSHQHRERVRRNRRATPFERAASALVAVAQRRLEFEEQRDKRLHERDIEMMRLQEQREKRLHEREVEMLRIESQRNEMAHKQNQLLQRLGVIAEKFIETLSEMRHTDGTKEKSDTIK